MAGGVQSKEKLLEAGLTVLARGNVGVGGQDGGCPAFWIGMDHRPAVVNPDHRPVFPDHPVFRLVVAVSAIQQALDLLPD